MDARVSNEVNYSGSSWGRQQAPSHWDRPVDVTVENVVRTFGRTPALHGVTQHRVRRARCVARAVRVGKTTLLGFAGLDVPTFGRVLFDGEDALKLTVQQRNVGLVFQNYALFRHMNVVDNIGFGLRVRPWARRKEIRKRALELLDLVQLSVSRSAIPPSSQAASASAWLRPSTRHRAARAPARRALRRARRQGAARPAPLAVGDPQQDGSHHGVRHPRPGGGARACRPRCGHERRQDRADRHARRNL